MDSMNLLPVNTDSGFGSPAIGAFAGALFGSWFGDGWAAVAVMVLVMAPQLL